MARRCCPSCTRRLPYAARRCVACGWVRGRGADAGAEATGAGLMRRALLVFLLATLVVVGGGLATRNAEGLANWYADVAARHLPDPFLSFAPRGTDRGAYLFCARQVARAMESDYSVETFPAPEQSSSERLADGRYRIRSWVEEALESGERVRHDFTCVIRHDRGRWRLEELALD